MQIYYKDRGELNEKYCVYPFVIEEELPCELTMLAV
jgi:hypothetical protein